MLTDSGATDAVVVRALADAAATIVSQSDSSTPDSEVPFGLSGDVIFDPERDRVVVAGLSTDRLIAVDLDTGVRTVLSDATSPSAFNVFTDIDEMHFEQGMEYIILLDALSRVIGVDIETGERLVVTSGNVNS